MGVFASQMCQAVFGGFLKLVRTRCRVTNLGIHIKHQKESEIACPQILNWSMRTKEKEDTVKKKKKKNAKKEKKKRRKKKEEDRLHLNI